MASYIFVCLFCVVLTFSVISGQRTEEDTECRREHGACTQHVYENIRLTALRSSGCKKFCQCVHASTELDGSVTYMWVQLECPPNTLFDDSLPARVCNHADRVQCHGDDDEEDCSSEHGLCSQYIYENVRLIAQRSSGCKKFCQCAHASTELDGSVTYHWVEQTCPAGTLFDNKWRVCNHAYNVPCDGNTETGGEVTDRPWVQDTTPIVSGVNDCFEEYGYCSRDQYENVRLVALRSSGCKNFCQCAHASTELDGSVTYKWVKKTCPAGTLFDESLPAPVCNHDYNVECPNDESQDCTAEHGMCTQFIYEMIRLVPKSSSRCEKFCQCAHASTELDGSVTYKWVEHNCPAGTLFDADLRVCNHADQVECGGNTGSIGFTTGSPPEQDTTPAGSGVNDCFKEYGYCSRDQYENVRLVALRSSGCKNFCQCAHASTELDGSVTYKWVKKTCPEGTLFDESLPAPVCNHDYNVQCPNDESQDCTAEHGMCTQFIYEMIRLVPKSSSGCEKFCQCAHASTELDGSVTYKWVEHNCPAGTLFDADLRVCNHADQVECDGNTGSIGFTTESPSEQETTKASSVEASMECFNEYGICSRNQYENVRLVALKSSGCKNFCQCAHASTELDGSVSYKWVKKTCPEGTLFDESLPAPVCNHDYNVQCTDAESEDCTAEYGVCTQNMYENVRLVPDKSSGCERFCQCAHASTELDGSVTYKWMEHDCPDGTLFDANLKVCNYADEVQCHENPPPQARILELLRKALSRADDKDCYDEYGTCSKDQYENVRLVALRSSGCKNFCQCAHASTQLDGSVTYKWVKQTCPAGTLFDMDLPARVCNHENQVHCPSIVGDEDACWIEHGTCTKDDYEIKRLTALRSSGCQKFCQCSFASTEPNGSVTYYWAEHTCPSGTLFDESLPTPVCNWAGQVGC